MKIAIGADHGGFLLKEALKPYLVQAGHTVIDVGASSDEPSDYPDIAALVAQKVMRADSDRGIVICGSGVGACVAANKFPRIRASVCHDTYSAHQGVEHDDMNVLCLGARIIGEALAKDIVSSFISAKFAADVERYKRRLDKVLDIERRFSADNT